MTRDFDLWLRQLGKELRWLPGTKRDEILTELGSDLANAEHLPDPAVLAVEILDAEQKKTEAHNGKRALAFMLDFMFSVIITVAFIIPVALVPEPQGAWWLAIIPLVLVGVSTSILWFPFFEALAGRTPGKMLMGLAVISEDGRPCSWGQAWIRRIPYLVQALFIIDAILIFFLPHRQRAFDKVAKTLVVEDPRGGVK